MIPTRSSVSVVISAVLVAGCTALPSGFDVLRPATPAAIEANSVLADGCETFTAQDLAALDIEIPRQRVGARDEGPLRGFARVIGMDGARERGVAIHIPELPGGFSLIRIFTAGDRRPSDPGGRFAMYWLGRGPADDQATLSSIRVAGDVLLSVDPAEPGWDESEAAAIEPSTGERSPHVGFVRVGGSRAALTIGMRWGDLRPVNVAWSDDRLVWQLQTGFPDPVDAVNLARALACGQPAGS